MNKQSGSISDIAKRLDFKHNVSIRVIDESSGRVVSEHTGHNASTNSLLTGIAHYLTGDGVLNQGEILSRWVPRYISLGTMGLFNQECDEYGLPAGIGVVDLKDEQLNFESYMLQTPGFGADGYDVNLNNNRSYLGIGPAFDKRPDESKTVNCELVINTEYDRINLNVIKGGYPRSEITFRDIVPETQAEYPETIDVIFSAFVSTGALAKFREQGKDYIFITEAGLWSRPDWVDCGDNGLLAGYRIAPPDEANWDMGIQENRDILKRNIIRVGLNQVVQVVWKIQIGGIRQLGNIDELVNKETILRWIFHPEEYGSDISSPVQWMSYPAEMGTPSDARIRWGEY